MRKISLTNQLITQVRTGERVGGGTMDSHHGFLFSLGLLNAMMRQPDAQLC